MLFPVKRQVYFLPIRRASVLRRKSASSIKENILCFHQEDDSRLAQEEIHALDLEEDLRLVQKAIIAEGGILIHKAQSSFLTQD